VKTIVFHPVLLSYNHELAMVRPILAMLDAVDLIFAYGVRSLS
jgi:hypothetical protein